MDAPHTLSELLASRIDFGVPGREAVEDLFYEREPVATMANPTSRYDRAAALVRAHGAGPETADGVRAVVEGRPLHERDLVALVERVDPFELDTIGASQRPRPSTLAVLWERVSTTAAVDAPSVAHTLLARSGVLELAGHPLSRTLWAATAVGARLSAVGASPKAFTLDAILGALKETGDDVTRWEDDTVGALYALDARPDVVARLLDEGASRYPAPVRMALGLCRHLTDPHDQRRLCGLDRGEHPDVTAALFLMGNPRVNPGLYAELESYELIGRSTRTGPVVPPRGVRGDYARLGDRETLSRLVEHLGSVDGFLHDDRVALEAGWLLARQLWRNRHLSFAQRVEISDTWSDLDDPEDAVARRSRMIRERRRPHRFSSTDEFYLSSIHPETFVRAVGSPNPPYGPARHGVAWIVERLGNEPRRYAYLLSLADSWTMTMPGLLEAVAGIARG